ncbi:type I toxin-antitoxin system Hok family toxin [Escherichia coli]|nr:type I toxin-antitoxin system Hok family toxin [Escherichia coli]
MLYTRRLASYVPKGKEKQAMKQQKAMLIALIVICLTVIVTALVTRKDLCEVRPLRRVFALVWLTKIEKCENMWFTNSKKSET